MSPDNVPPWGCPRHGLIKGGELQLQGGIQIPMRQPGGAWPFERGRTSLIDLGAPPVIRSIEQQQSDIAAGIHWEHRAILAGDQIHGREIGAGSWIYRAPDGSNWLASTTLHGASALVSGSTINLTLTRFGVLGEPAEEYSYSVAVPDLAPGIGYWGFNPGDVQLLRYDTHPQGRASSFAMYARLDIAGNRAIIAWVELMLTGPADECEASVELIYDAARTAGASEYVDDTGQARRRYGVRWDAEINDTTSTSPCGGRYEITSSPSFVPLSSDEPGGVLTFPGGTYRRRSAQLGNILGVIYSSDGARQTVELDCEIETTTTAAPPQTLETRDRYMAYHMVSTSGGACMQEYESFVTGLISVRQETVNEATATVTIKLGGQVILVEADTYRHAAVHTLTDENGFAPPGPPGAGGSIQRTWSATRSDGAAIEYSDTAPAGLAEELGVTREGFRSISSPVFLRQPGYLSYSVAGLADNLPGFSKQVIRSAPDVFSLLSIVNNSVASSYPRQGKFSPMVATRSGAANLPSHSFTLLNAVTPQPFAYASYNPLTGEVARAIDSPVCWT